MFHHLNVNIVFLFQDVNQLKKCDEPSRKRRCFDKKSLKTDQNVNYSQSVSDKTICISSKVLFDGDSKFDAASTDFHSKSVTGKQRSSEAAMRESDSDGDDGILNTTKKTEKYVDVETADLHTKLLKVDEEMAKSIHPNHRRKILR